MANAFFNPQIRAQIEAANARQNMQGYMQIAPVQSFMQALASAGQTSGKLLGAGIAGLASSSNPREAIMQVMDPQGYAQGKALQAEQERQKQVVSHVQDIQNNMGSYPAFKRTEELMRRAAGVLSPQEVMTLRQQRDKQFDTYQTQQRLDRQESRQVAKQQADQAFRERQFNQSERFHYDKLRMDAENRRQQAEERAEKQEADDVNKLIGLSSKQEAPIEKYRNVVTYYNVMKNSAANYTNAEQLNFIQAFTKSMDPTSVTTSGEVRATDAGLKALANIGIKGINLSTLQEILNGGTPLKLNERQIRSALGAVYSRVQPFQDRAFGQQKSLIREFSKRGLPAERILDGMGGPLPELGSRADIAQIPINIIEEQSAIQSLGQRYLPDGSPAGQAGRPQQFDPIERSLNGSMQSFGATARILDEMLNPERKDMSAAERELLQSIRRQGFSAGGGF